MPLRFPVTHVYDKRQVSLLFNSRMLPGCAEEGERISRQQCVWLVQVKCNIMIWGPEACLYTVWQQ